MTEQEKRDQELRREGFRAGMARAHRLLFGVYLIAADHLAYNTNWYNEARDAYPITRTETRPREVRLDAGIGRYRFNNGVLEYEVVPDLWQRSQNTMEQWSPSDLRALADLKENPTETVEVDE